MMMSMAQPQPCAGSTAARCWMGVCGPGLHFTWLKAALMEGAWEKTVPPGLAEGTEGTTRVFQAVPIGSHQNTEEWVLLLFPIWPVGRSRFPVQEGYRNV